MAKRQLGRDAVQEHRIAAELIVDEYGSEEQALGWHYYREEQIEDPFATCDSLCASLPYNPDSRTGPPESGF